MGVIVTSISLLISQGTDVGLLNIWNAFKYFVVANCRREKQSESDFVFLLKSNSSISDSWSCSECVLYVNHIECVFKHLGEWQLRTRTLRVLSSPICCFFHLLSFWLWGGERRGAPYLSDTKCITQPYCCNYQLTINDNFST